MPKEKITWLIARRPVSGVRIDILSFFLGFLVLMTIFVPMVGESRPG
jgi:hypothetical protein